MKITKDIFIYPKKHISEQLSEEEKILYSRLYDFLRLPYEYGYPIDKYEDSYGKILIDFDMSAENGFIYRTQENGAVQNDEIPINGFIISEHMFGIKSYCPCDEDHYNNVGIFWFNPCNIVTISSVTDDSLYSNINNLCNDLVIGLAHNLDDIKLNIWENMHSQSNGNFQTLDFVLPKIISDLLKSYVIEASSGHPTLISCAINGTMHGMPIEDR